MPDAASARSYATVFHEIAGEYDRHRPAYPDALIDQACQLAGIGPGAPVPALLEHTAEHTADELNALLGTMSFWARLAPRQRDALAAENRALYQRLGRPIRSGTVACLVAARREPRT